MAKRIKRFFVFLFFSIFFSLLSGRIDSGISQKGKQPKIGNGLGDAWAAGTCCQNNICNKVDENGNVTGHYCC